MDLLDTLTPATDPETRGLRRAFALKVMRPGTNALLIDEKNVAIGRLALDEALDTGLAYAVDVADDVLALDADTPEAAAALVRTAGDLKSAGHAPVVLASGQPDRRHLFARIRDAAALARYKKAAVTAGLDVRSTIRPPLAPHRMGWPVALLDPEDPAEALAALTPPRRRPLSPAMDALLREGAPKGRRSNVIQRVALAAVNAHWTLAEFTDAILAAKLGEKAQEKKDPRAYVKHSWDKAVTYAAEHPASRVNEDIAERLDAIRAAIDASPWKGRWKGRGGTTALSVVRAHVAIVELAGSLEHGASARHAAELAKVQSCATIRDKRNGVWTRLVRLGFLVRLPRTGRQSASRWLLRLPPPGYPGHAHVTAPPTPPTLQGGRVPNGRGGYVSHDLWRWNRGGLGKAAEQAYEWLDRPMTTAQLGDELGVRAPAVRRRLRRLLNAAIIEKNGRTWRRTNRTLDDAVQGRGVAGETDRQRARHEDERERYRDSLKRQAEEDARDRQRAEETKRRERQEQEQRFKEWWKAWGKAHPDPGLTDNDYGYATTGIVKATTTAVIAETATEGRTRSHDDLQGRLLLRAALAEVPVE